MPYQNIGVLQSEPFTLANQGASISVGMTGVAAGSLLLAMGGFVHHDTSKAILASGVTGGGTWSSPVNARPSTDNAPNAFLSVAHNVSAGAPTVVVANNKAVGDNSTVRATGAILEIEKAHLTAALASSPTGTNGGSATSSSLSTGALPQSKVLLVYGVFGWIGVPGSMATPWVPARTPQQNGSYLGGYIGTRVVDDIALASVVTSLTYDPTPGCAMVLAVIRAAEDGTLYVEFELPSFDATLRPDGIGPSEANVEGMLWRNVEPYSASGAAAGYTYHSPAQIAVDAGTKPGDSTGRLLKVTGGLPTGTALGDTFQGQFRKTGGITKGTPAVIPGIVKSA